MSTKRIKGITIEIGGDTTKLSTALSGVDKEIKNTQSQLKDVERLLKLDPTNTELLTQKQKLLADAVRSAKEKLDTLKKASEQAAKTKDNYDAWKAKYEPIKQKITETEDKLKKLKAQSQDADEQLANGKISQEKYDQIQSEIQATSDDLKALRQSAKDVSDEFGNPISPEQYDSLQREIFETEQELQNLSREAEISNVTLSQISEIGGVLQETGGKVSEFGEKLMPVTEGILGIGTAAVEAAAEFDAQMSKVMAISGATDTEIELLRNKARDMGETTKFSAVEAGQAMEYMSMAGWKTDDMLNGIEGIMNLAAASGEELATTSDIVTDALTALGMGADESGHFADVLAAASSNANTNVSMLGESFKYVAPIAGSMEASAEDLSIALGLMANSGIKGTQAGNSLKNALVNLVKPTDAQTAAMAKLGLVTAETVTEIDNDKLEKAQTKFENKTLDLQKAQLKLNDSVAKYGEDSVQAQTAMLNLQKAENNLTLAQDELTEAQQGTIKVVSTGQSAFEDEYGNMKSLGEIMEVLRTTLGKVDVDLTDSEGNMREYDDIIAELSETEEGLTQAEQLKNAAILFGKQNVSGMLAIINAADEDYQSLSESIYNCEGAAKSMSETMQDNLSGQITILKSQLAELAISFGEILMPFIRDVVSWIQKVADKLNSMSPTTRIIVIAIAGVVAAIGPLLIIIGKIITAVGTIMTIIPKLVTAFNAVKAAMMAPISPAIAVIAIITALVAAFIYLWNNCEGFREFWINLWEKIKEAYKDFQDAWSLGMDMLMETIENIKNFFIEQWEKIKEAYQSFQDAWKLGVEMLKETIENIKNFFSDRVENIKTHFNNIIDFVKNVFTGNWSGAWENIKNIFKNIWDSFENIAKTPLNAIISLINSVISGINTMISNLNGINISIPDWVPAVGGNSIGFNLPTIPNIPMLAKGGVVTSGSAIVGEAGPELLSVANGRAVVTPLTNSSKTENMVNSPVYYITNSIHVDKVSSDYDIKRINEKLADEQRHSFAAVGGW